MHLSNLYARAHERRRVPWPPVRARRALRGPGGRTAATPSRSRATRPFGPVAPQPARPIGAFTHGELPATPTRRVPDAERLAPARRGGRRRAAGARVDPRRRLRRGVGERVALRRRAPGAGRAGGGHHHQLPPRLAGLAASTPSWAAANWGLRDQQAALRWVAGQRRGVRRRPRARDARGPVGGRAQRDRPSPCHWRRTGCSSGCSCSRRRSSTPPTTPAMPTRWAEALADARRELRGAARAPGRPARRAARGALGRRPVRRDARRRAADDRPRDAARPAGRRGPRADRHPRAARHDRRRGRVLLPRRRAPPGARRGAPDRDGRAHAGRDRRARRDRRLPRRGWARQTDTNTLLVRIGGDHMVIGPTDAWARERARAPAARSTACASTTRADPDLGAMHSIDAPLLFGTYGDGGPGTRMAGEHAARRSGLEVLHERRGGLRPRRCARLGALDADGSGALAVFGGPEGTPPQTVSAI